MLFRRRDLFALSCCAAAMGLTPAPHAGAHDDHPAAGAMEWRNIGPARGGRASSVAGVVGDPMTYYMGATGGGVWKTTDAGGSWTNVTDGFLGTGSVGAVTVAQSDPNVVYIGMGETCVRGNLSHGDGVYRSTDAGKTWTHIGLDDSRHIGRIAVHPGDADTLFVAALGHVFGPSNQRGLYRSTDGGDTWERVLFVSDRAGAVDVSIDPHNPRVLYASTWEVSRSPWSLDSGGPGSALYRSTDGGDTWTELTDGLPKGVKGRIGVSASAAQRDLVYAIVEAEDGGVFRSDNGGDSWRRVNDDRDLRQRAWYYTHIYADPQDAETVYVMNVGFHKSIDGGRTYSRIRVPHGDNHDLWIDPHNNARMVNANDGGANVSFNGGDSWSRQDNQPTAQFYHVIADNSFPYRVLGAQQDNSTVSISHTARPGRGDFHDVGGGESGYIAPRHDNPDIIYAGSYGGYLTRYDHDLGVTRNISAWPENPMGAGAADLDFRFQWTFPIVVSQHDPDVVYVGANVLMRSDDDGESWRTISPDLTTNDKTKQQSSGGPVTQDNTSVEYYCTIFAVAESPFDDDTIWVGSDDGLVHVTRDGGRTWTNVTPKGMGDWPMISLIEHSAHDADTVYLAVNRYKMDDDRPQIYVTRDGGESWTKIVRGIDDGAFVRAVREDHQREGLLFAGTELGVYVSLDAGANWSPLQRNLPVVPITDLVVKGDDLVVATQGRSFWILDDIAPLRQYDSAMAQAPFHLFEPTDAWRQGWDRVQIQYHLKEAPAEPITLAIHDASGDLVREFTSAESSERAPRVPAEAGMNAFEWNMRYPDPVRVPGAVAWPPHPPGPMAAPGDYTVSLTVGDVTIERPFSIRADPRLDTTQEEYDEQFDFLMEINSVLSEAHEAINTIRAAREQINAVVAQAKKANVGDDLAEAAKAINADLTAIEETLIQTKSKSSQDPLNFPIRLNDKIGALAYVAEGEYKPTKQSYDVLAKLRSAVQRELVKLDKVVGEDIPAFNRLVERKRIPAVVIDEN